MAISYIMCFEHQSDHAASQALERVVIIVHKDGTVLMYRDASCWDDTGWPHLRPLVSELAGVQGIFGSLRADEDLNLALWVKPATEGNQPDLNLVPLSGFKRISSNLNRVCLAVGPMGSNRVLLWGYDHHDRPWVFETLSSGVIIPKQLEAEGTTVTYQWRAGVGDKNVFQAEAVFDCATGRQISP